MKQILISACLLLLIACPATAGDDDPVKLSDLNRMLKAGGDTQAALVVMSERGVGFRLTASAKRKLKGMGFTDEDLGHLQGIIDGEPFTPPADDPADEGAGPDGEAGPGDPDDPNDKDLFPIGHGHSPRYTATMAKVLERGIAGARVGYRTYPLDRATLYCSAGKSKETLPILQAIEKTLVDNLPACLSNATGPTTTIFVVTDTRKDFETLIKSVVLSYDKQWPGYKKGVTLSDKTTYKIFGNIMYIDGSAIKGGELFKRYLAFSWGYMAADQISEHEVPDAIRLGMGNLVERLYMGTPDIVLFSDSGQEDQEIPSWQGFVQERLKKKDLPKPDRILGYTSGRMHNAEYAVAWSFTEHLAKDPLALYRYLDSTRESFDPLHHELLSEAYGTELDTLFEQWKKSIAGP